MRQQNTDRRIFGLAEWGFASLRPGLSRLLTSPFQTPLNDTSMPTLRKIEALNSEYLMNDNNNIQEFRAPTSSSSAETIELVSLLRFVWKGRYLIALGVLAGFAIGLFQALSEQRDPETQYLLSIDSRSLHVPVTGEEVVRNFNAALSSETLSKIALEKLLNLEPQFAQVKRPTPPTLLSRQTSSNVENRPISLKAGSGANDYLLVIRLPDELNRSYPNKFIEDFANQFVQIFNDSVAKMEMDAATELSSRVETKRKSFYASEGGRVRDLFRERLNLEVEFAKLEINLIQSLTSGTRRDIDAILPKERIASDNQTNNAPPLESDSNRILLLFAAATDSGAIAHKDQEKIFEQIRYLRERLLLNSLKLEPLIAVSKEFSNVQIMSEKRLWNPLWGAEKMIPRFKLHSAVPEFPKSSFTNILSRLSLKLAVFGTFLGFGAAIVIHLLRSFFTKHRHEIFLK